jgi:hypothetical protein
MQVRTAGPADLLQRCAGLLAADPVTTNVVATAAAAEVRRGTVRSCFLWVERDGAPTAVAVLTPGFPFSLSDCTDAEAAALADALLERGCVVLGAGGPVTAARAFVRRWTARTGVPVTRVMRQGVYLCDDAVLPPVGVPGRSRPAREADTSQAQRWLQDFAVEAGLGRRPRTGRRRWWPNGACTCGWTGTVVTSRWPRCGASDGGLARLGPVWTPVADRRHGYASALTADLTAQLLAAGSASCCSPTWTTRRPTGSTRRSATAASATRSCSASDGTAPDVTALRPPVGLLVVDLLLDLLLDLRDLLLDAVVDHVVAAPGEQEARGHGSSADQDRGTADGGAQRTDGHGGLQAQVAVLPGRRVLHASA